MNVARSFTAVAAAGLAVVALASPAAADPAKPTDYRSRVTSVEPASDAVDVRVVGGDSFLQLEVEAGHEVVVVDYTSGDDPPTPYLRIEADGTVSQNRNAEATYVNDDRYGTRPPEDLDESAPPDWEVLDDDGEHTWHDHRIHWMSPDRPPQASAGDVIYDDWVVPLVVDGEPVEVHGTLTWEESTIPALWFGIAAIGAVGLVAAARRRAAVAAAAIVLVAAVFAVVVGFAEQASIPAGAGGSTLAVAIPALAVALGAVAVWRRGGGLGAAAALAAVALVVSWAVLRIDVLLRPVLPTDLAANVDRLGTALALGMSVAAAALVVRSGALRLPDLADDEDDVVRTGSGSG